MRILFCRFVFATLLSVFLLSGSAAQASLPQGLLDSIPETPIDLGKDLATLAQQNGSTGDYFKLKLAESYIKSSNTTEALKLIGKVEEPLFAFWKNTLLAEIYFSNDKPHEALALLKDMPKPPRHEVAFGEGNYESIYRDALITRYLANKKLARDTSEDAALLLSLFPKDSEILSIVEPNDQNITFTLTQKLLRLHALHSRYQYKDVAGLVDAGSILSANISTDAKCESLYELGNSLRTVSGQGGNAVAAFKGILNLHCDADKHARALYWLGSINDGANTNAADTRPAYLLKLNKEFPNSKLADDAIFKLYKIAEKKNDKSGMEKYAHQLFSL